MKIRDIIPFLFFSACLYASCPTFNGTDNFIEGASLISNVNTNTTPLTIMCWFNSNVNNAQPQAFVSFKDGSNVGRTYLYVDYSAGGFLTTFFGGVGTHGTTVISTNTWHHAAVTHNPTNGALFLYLDGVQEATGTVTGDVNANFGYVVGCHKLKNQQFMDGQIADVRVYTYIMTAQEIFSIAKSKSYIEEGSNACILHLRLDDGKYGSSLSTGTVFVDISNNKNNGKFGGSTNSYAAPLLNYIGN